MTGSVEAPHVGNRKQRDDQKLCGATMAKGEPRREEDSWVVVTSMVVKAGRGQGLKGTEDMEIFLKGGMAGLRIVHRSSQFSLLQAIPLALSVGTRNPIKLSICARSINRRPIQDHVPKRKFDSRSRQRAAIHIQYLNPTRRYLAS